MPSLNEGERHADFFEHRFHLTHAEARLVAHLVQGTSLKCSAEALGIKYETVHSYLKSAFQKTGTHRQAELVLKVFSAMSDSYLHVRESGELSDVLRHGRK